MYHPLQAQNVARNSDSIEPRMQKRKTNIFHFYIKNNEATLDTYLGVTWKFSLDFYWLKWLTKISLRLIS